MAAMDTAIVNVPLPTLARVFQTETFPKSKSGDTFQL